MTVMVPQVSHQRGAIVPMMAGALVAILGVTALAVDVGNAFRHKALLQNGLDAAALSGAKVLNTTSDVLAAEQEARTVVKTNAALSGSGELFGQLQDESVSLSVEFSSTLYPFTNGTTPARYIRIKAQDVSVSGYFARVLGLERFALAGSAVAGPSPTLFEACNVVPMMVCGDSSAPHYGYTPGEVVQLKSAAGQDSEVGPGNFQLIRLDDSTGANDLRHAMAGSYENCMDMNTSEAIETEPGNTVGPVAQGLNTRLGIYKGAIANDREKYPPDLVTTHPDFRYADYMDRYRTRSFTDPDGAWERRILAIPFGDCSVVASGQASVPLLGFGCFFLLEETPQTGNESVVKGEFIADCQAQGMPGPNPGSGTGPFIIQLYEDPQSPDS